MQVKRVIPLFEYMYPNAVAEFIFDQSSAHGAFAPDALNAKEMNVNPGGKQRRMHPTIIPDDAPNPAVRGQVQDMIFPNDLPPHHPYFQFRGQPKGMRVILEERGILAHVIAQNGGKVLPGDCANCKMSQRARDKAACETAAATSESFYSEINTDDEDSPSLDAYLPTSTCCMRRIMSLQKDFCSEKPLLQIIIEEAGHKCYFLPKFHCELNPIEMYWGWVKMRT